MYFFYTIFVEYSHKCELIAEILLMKEYKGQYRKLTCFFNDREVREVCVEKQNSWCFSAQILLVLLTINLKIQSRRIQRANALHHKVIKSFRKNTQKEYKNLIFLLVED